LSPAARSGELVFLSGQLALRDGALQGGDVTAQTHVVFDNIETVLTEVGLTLSNVVKATIWLRSAADFGTFNRAYAERFGDHRPARSAVVSELLIEGALVEIEVIAEAAA
jgi:2-iminobutanoate/2-iminopropanoate deaminase